jgi:hypothetical protein
VYTQEFKEVRQPVFMYIEAYYNRVRMHSALSNLRNKEDTRPLRQPYGRISLTANQLPEANHERLNRVSRTVCNTGTPYEGTGTGGNPETIGYGTVPAESP